MKRSKDESAIIAVVAANVRHFRGNETQESLAHRAGLDRTYISQVERRQRNVTIGVLARIAAALQIAPEHLLSPLVSSATPISPAVTPAAAARKRTSRKKRSSRG